jgi:hypothetical protein
LLGRYNDKSTMTQAKPGLFLCIRYIISNECVESPKMGRNRQSQLESFDDPCINSYNKCQEKKKIVIILIKSKVKYFFINCLTFF